MLTHEIPHPIIAGAGLAIVCLVLGPSNWSEAQTGAWLAMIVIAPLHIIYGWKTLRIFASSTYRLKLFGEMMGGRKAANRFMIESGYLPMFFSFCLTLWFVQMITEVPGGV